MSVFFLIFIYFPAIAAGVDASFNKDQDILVLPLDLMKYDTHGNLTQDVLKHFGKVLIAVKPVSPAFKEAVISCSRQSPCHSPCVMAYYRFNCNT